MPSTLSTARIARLEAGRGAKILIAEVGSAVRVGERLLDLRVHLENAEVREIDRRAVVGDEVEMTFRRLYSADGVHNYFWKARPKR